MSTDSDEVAHMSDAQGDGLAVGVDSEADNNDDDGHPSLPGGAKASSAPAEGSTLGSTGVNSKDASPIDAIDSAGARLNGATTDGSADASSGDIEVLQTENAFLRLALEEAQEKLRVADAAASDRTCGSPRSVRPSRKEPGNGGVAYARMRRLLLKDDCFLREQFLPFLDIEDLARYSAVCRRFKKVTYDANMVTRCVEAGGVTDSTRGLLWLIMVGMDPAEARSRGVLGAVIQQQPESPEEQYDRLHRAMNGTTSAASPTKPGPQVDVGASGSPPVGPRPTNSGVETGPDVRKPQERRGRDKRGVIVSDDESGSSLSVEVEGGFANTSRSSSSYTMDDDAVGGTGGGGSSVGGDASVGSDSVLLWEEDGKGSMMSPRVGLGASAPAGANPPAVAVPNDEHAAAAVTAATLAAEEAAEEAAEAASIAAMANAAAEAADAAFAAEAAAGIRPLGGRGTAKMDHHDAAAEAIEVAGKKAEMAAELAEAAADVAHGEAGGGGDGARSFSPTASAGAGAGISAATEGAAAGGPSSGVVGWASGLFRRTASTSSGAVPPSMSRTASPARPMSERGIRALDTKSLHHRQSTSTSSDFSSPTASKITRGLLFGLRYARYNKPKSALPADAGVSSTAGGSRSFFGEGAGKEQGRNQGVGNASDGKDADDGGSPTLERVPGLYSALLNSADAMDANDMTGVRGPKQSCFVDIEKDLKRTLGMTDVTPLRNVLRCTSTFVPDVGYVQGMNFVCRCLLQVYDDEEEAFWVFVGMLQRFGLRRLYCPGMPLLRLRFFQLNRLLMWHLPELYEHFETCGVQTNLFATSWFVTLLSDGGMLPDKEVKVMWDRIFLHRSSPASQWAPIFLFLLELLRRAQNALIEETRFSELIQKLVNMPFRELCEGQGTARMIKEAGRRFETSSPMPVQLLLLHDQWTEGGAEDGNNPENDDDKQLL